MEDIGSILGLLSRKLIICVEKHKNCLLEINFSLFAFPDNKSEPESQGLKDWNWKTVDNWFLIDFCVA